MSRHSCTDCGGTLLLRESGLWSCQECGKLEIMPVADPEPETQRAPMPPDLPLSGDLVVPDYTEVMVGWRAWGVPESDEGVLPVLQSVTHTKQHWTPRQVMEAQCIRKGGRKHEPGQIPLERCTCGLYAAKGREHLQSMRYHKYDAEQGGLYHVIGSVSLWGKVIEGTQGWRAQYGYPRELYVPFEAWHLRERLTRAYGVPVRLQNILSTEQQEA